MYGFKVNEQEFKFATRAEYLAAFSNAIYLANEKPSVQLELELPPPKPIDPGDPSPLPQLDD